MLTMSYHAALGRLANSLSVFRRAIAQLVLIATDALSLDSSCTRPVPSRFDANQRECAWPKIPSLVRLSIAIVRRIFP